MRREEGTLGRVERGLKRTEIVKIKGIDPRDRANNRVSGLQGHTAHIHETLWGHRSSPVELGLADELLLVVIVEPLRLHGSVPFRRKSVWEASSVAGTLSTQGPLKSVSAVGFFPWCSSSTQIALAMDRNKQHLGADINTRSLWGQLSEGHCGDTLRKVLMFKSNSRILLFSGRCLTPPTESQLRLHLADHPESAVTFHRAWARN